MKLSLPWKWFAALALMLAALLLIVNLAIGFYLTPFLDGKIHADLERNARLTRETFAPLLQISSPPVTDINALAHTLSQQTGLRVTILAPDGIVLGESDKPTSELARMENHFQHPEVQAALRTGMGSARRHSEMFDVDLQYVATAVRDGSGVLHGFVRIALPLHQIQQTTKRMRSIVAAASGVVLLAALPLTFWMARRITQPIVAMREVVGRVARGDFSKRAPVQIGGELGELATTLNNMSAQMETRLRELAAEKADLSAVLASMTEGVAVVDADGKIRLANAALRQQFQLGDEAIGRTLLETLRNVLLHEMASAVARGQMALTRELTFLTPAERVFDINAASLRVRGDGTTLGGVIVFHDITRIKKLENVRKEFVANVSHELRTPLSIIKGYVETLLDDQPPDAETTKQFLHIVQRHSTRLEALIEDLLTISALESQRAELQFDAVSLAAATDAVIEELTRKASDKKITIANEIPADLSPARADGRRLHQVLVNLLDNAIKYTPAGGRIRVSAIARPTELEICVADNGAGIEMEHLPHIFERFYRVDKARSREQGGTGLGLSIVKHIIQAHGGRAWAESELGKGSSFYFTLPLWMERKE